MWHFLVGVRPMTSAILHCQFFSKVEYASIHIPHPTTNIYDEVQKKQAPPQRCVVIFYVFGEIDFWKIGGNLDVIIVLFLGYGHV